MTKLTDSREYRAFLKDRNRALEELLQKQKIRNAAVLRTALEKILGIAALYHSTRDERALRNQIEMVFNVAAMRTYENYRRFRRMYYLLAKAGEAEAISRVLGQDFKLDASSTALDQIVSLDSPSGGNLSTRIRLSFNRLRRRVESAIEFAVLTGKDINDAVISVFPRPKRVKKPPKAAKSPSLQEADARRTGIKKSVGSSIIDDSAWQDLVSEYRNEFLPIGRGPEDVTRYQYGKTEYEIYDWELERELTQDFVTLVRKGQVDAAKENGIRDFVWIAIIDDKTDECCFWRDGLTTKEIEEKLRTTERRDECRTTVPPAHFNCRCDLAPVTDALPEKPREELGAFDTWLK